MLEAHSWKNPDACQPSPGRCSQMSKPRLREERRLAFRFNEEYFGCKLTELSRISLSTKQVFIRIRSRQEQLQKNSRGGELQEQLDPVLGRDCPTGLYLLCFSGCWPTSPYFTRASSMWW